MNHAGTTLQDRLRSVVENAGGINAVAAQTEISRAQLARYVDGTPIPSDRVKALCVSLGVSMSWLLEGHDNGYASVSTVYNNLNRFTERLLAVLQRYDTPKAFLPKEIASVVQLMCLSHFHHYTQAGRDQDITDQDIEAGLDFLDCMRAQGSLETYVHGCQQITIYGWHMLEPALANEWTRIVQDAFRARFETEALIAGYFWRLNVPIWDTHLRIMQDWNALLMERKDRWKGRVRLLDAGCGNGRHLIYLHQHGSGYDLKGIDTCAEALDICKKHETGGKLPKGCTSEGNFFDLELPDESVDAYMSIANLMFVPYIVGSFDCGVGRIFQEAARVLASSGLALFLVRAKLPEEFFPTFRASHPIGNLAEMAKQVGLNLVKRDPVQLKPVNTPGTRFGRGLIHQEVLVFEKAS